MQDIKTLNNKELQALSKQIKEEETRRKQEKREKRERKRNYALLTPDPEYTFNYFKFADIIRSHKGKLPELDKIITHAEKVCTEQKPHKNEEVYPCPECGAQSLFAADFGDLYNPKYKIRCSYCDFIAPVRKYSEEHDAWDAFHEWLVKEGYLEE